MVEKAVFYIIDGRNAKNLCDAPKKKYTVQYNPSELSVSAGEPQKKNKNNKMYKAGTGKKRKTASYSSEKYSVRVSFTLIFDRTEEYLDSMRKTGNAGADINVSTEVDGFIAMIQNPNIRCFIFSWGALCYPGELTSVSGQYTMFSESGAPIRASLNLTMSVKDIYNNNQWWGMYKSAFGGGGTCKKLGVNVVKGLERAVIKIVKAKYDSSTKKITANGSSFYKLEVQYNPASLSLSSSAGRQALKEETDEENKQEAAGSELSFQLIFDASEPQDNKVDIAAITNGLISLMSDKELTEVEFGWGGMVFAGNLTSIQGKFTMFSEKGVPLRSSVDISIVGSAGGEDYRNKAFNKLTEKKYGNI